MSMINYASREINCKIVYYGPGLGGPRAPYLTYVNRGWRAEGAAQRHTVRSNEFVETRTFPRRAAGRSHHEALVGAGRWPLPALR